MKTKSVKFNFIMNTLLTLSSIIFPIITFPYISRILLPLGTGKVSFATSVITYFAMFAQLGIPTYGIRACAKVRDSKEELSKVVHEIFIINSIMSIFVYIIFFISLKNIPRLYEDKWLFIIMSSTIFFNIIGVEWLYKGLERYSYITIRSIIFKFIALIAMFVMIHKQSDYIIYGGLTIIAAVGSNIFNFLNIKNIISLKFFGNYNFKRHLEPILIFFAMSVATTVYTNLDMVMLGFMKTNTDVGYYTAAVKIKSVLLGIVTSLGTVLLPRASYYIENNLYDEFNKITKKAINFVLLIAAPLSVYFILFSRPGILFISGDSYLGAILPMQVIMPTVLLVGLTNIMGIQMLIPLGREKTVLYSVTAGAIVDLIVNILLIPKFSSAGAAAGTLIAELVVLIIQYFSLRDTVKIIFKKLQYWKILIGIICGTIGSFWVKSLNISSFLILIVSSLLFFGIYGLLLLITRERLFLDIKSNCLNYIKRLTKK